MNQKWIPWHRGTEEALKKSVRIRERKLREAQEKLAKFYEES